MVVELRCMTAARWDGVGARVHGGGAAAATAKYSKMFVCDLSNQISLGGQQLEQRGISPFFSDVSRKE